MKPPIKVVRAGSSFRLASSRRHSAFTFGLSCACIFIFAISADGNRVLLPHEPPPGQTVELDDPVLEL